MVATKATLANALKELMQTTPLEKISVTDIVGKAEMNRQTFYYHFKDKYALVNWIFCTEAVERFPSIYVTDRWDAGLKQILSHMQENRLFYVNALSIRGKNSLCAYLFGFAHSLTMNVIKQKVGDRVSDVQQFEYIADFYGSAFVGNVVRWAERGMNKDPVRFIERAKNLVEGGIEREIFRIMP